MKMSASVRTEALIFIYAIVKFCNGAVISLVDAVFGKGLDAVFGLFIAVF